MRPIMVQHQYIERETHSVCNEQLYWDRIINFFYSRVRENSPAFFRVLTGPRLSKILGFITYDAFLGKKLSGNRGFLKRCAIDLQECVETVEFYDTPRKIFERQIRYWETRYSIAGQKPPHESCQGVVPVLTRRWAWFERSAKA